MLVPPCTQYADDWQRQTCFARSQVNAQVSDGSTPVGPSFFAPPVATPPPGEGGAAQQVIPTRDALPAVVRDLLDELDLERPRPEELISLLENMNNISLPDRKVKLQLSRAITAQIVSLEDVAEPAALLARNLNLQATLLQAEGETDAADHTRYLARFIGRYGGDASTSAAE